MPKKVVFTLKLEGERRDQFMAEAAATDRPASQPVCAFMRDFGCRQREARAHDAWVRAEVARGLREADDPETKRIPHREIKARWRRRRAELVKRVGGKPT